MTKHGMSATARFWSHVNKNGPTMPGMRSRCWVWTAGRFHDGYGSFGVLFRSGRKKIYRAHRFSWEIINGVIPDGLLSLHKCDNILCVRQSHLFLGTDKDNADDRGKKGRTSKGSTRAGSKLDEEKVKLARELVLSGKDTIINLAKSFGVRSYTLKLAVVGRTWKHVV